MACVAILIAGTTKPLLTLPTIFTSDNVMASDYFLTIDKSTSGDESSQDTGKCPVRAAFLTMGGAGLEPAATCV
jgi:hypothetical protein